jgi:hypothetical protein
MILVEKILFDFVCSTDVITYTVRDAAGICFMSISFQRKHDSGIKCRFFFLISGFLI